MREEYTEDRALMIGMGATMLLLVLVFAVLMTLLIAAGIPWYVVIAVAASVGVYHYLKSDSIAFAACGAVEVTAAEAPELHAVIERLAAIADVPKPKKIAIINSDTPNAMAMGRNPQNAAIAVTNGLMTRLNPQEMECVLAHEISHIKNRDIMVMNFATIVTHLTSYLMVALKWSFIVVAAAAAALWAFGSRDVKIMAAVLIGVGILYLYMGIAYAALWIIRGINSMLILALSRTREYAADRSAAALTGAPAQLGAALQKIDDEMSLLPEDDFRRLEKVNAFMIIPAMKQNFFDVLLSTHPRTEKRIRKLQNMQYELERET